MSQKSLKRILRKDEVTQRLIRNLCHKLGIQISIVEENSVLWGEKEILEYQFPIKLEEEIVGILHADSADGKLLAELIEVLVSKEEEKKKMGSEVLGLYREINIIYDFSEKISEIIEANSIAEMALHEASQIIDSSYGLFLIFDPEKSHAMALASFGLSDRQIEDINTHNSLLKKLIHQGTASILAKLDIEQHPALSSLQALMYAPLKVKHRTLGLVMLGHHLARDYTAAELKLLTTISLQSASAIETAHLYQKGLREAKEREDAIREIHEVSSKFVPYEFIHSLGKSQLTEVALGDQVEREVTVVFADIRDFTSFSEGMAPADNFLFVNAFNKRMGPIIRQNRGFINQYLGDGFMAIFPHSAQDALRASVQMHTALKQYNSDRAQKNRRPIKMGVGMQIGKLIMGITGDIDRMDAATISDTVNTAARIESLSKHYGTSILLTGDCKENLSHPDEFDFRYLGLVQVKGKSHPLELYECINGDGEDLFQHKIATNSAFTKALNQYFEKEFAIAALAFQQIVKKHSNDTTARLFLNRAAKLIIEEVEEDWLGIESIKVK